ncbi:MAG: tetratricopeptide repeat protein, partial [Bacteroidales bacterium]|nr:tetratricopeptide repeat protein [Bacteroidales bacterium]
RAQNLDDKDIYYNNRALKIRTDLLLFSKKYIAEVAQSNFNLGRVYFSMKDYEKAEPYYIKSKDIFYELCKTKAAAYKPIYALTVFNLGILYAEKKDKKEAKKHYKKAKKAYSELEKEKKGEYIDNIKSVNKYLDELRQK